MFYKGCPPAVPYNPMQKQRRLAPFQVIKHVSPSVVSRNIWRDYTGRNRRYYSVDPFPETLYLNHYVE